MTTANDPDAPALLHALPAPLLRRATPDQYAERERQDQAQRDQRAAAALATAAPVVAAVEAVLNKGFPLHRLISESGVSGGDTVRLLNRVRPHEVGPVDLGWTFQQLAQAIERWGAWMAASPDYALRSAQFAPTPTHRAIYNLIANAQRAKRLLVIVGGFGVGKTCAAEAATAMRPRQPGVPGLVKVEIRETDRIVGRMLETIYFGIVHRERHAMGGTAMAELCKLLHPGDVLILDECQRLASCGNGRGVEVIRELFDNAPASIVLMGNERMKTRSNVLDRNVYGALASRARIYEREFLQLTEEDIDVFMAWRGLSGIELRRELVDIAIRHDSRAAARHAPATIGGLRVIADLCDRAAEAYPGQTITGAMIRAVLG